MALACTNNTNKSNTTASLREENAWGADGTVAVVGKRKKCVAAGGSAAPTETVEHDDQTLLLDDCAHAEAETVKYGYKDPSIDLQTCPVKCVGSFISTDRAPLPELIPVTVDPGNN